MRRPLLSALLTLLTIAVAVPLVAGATARPATAASAPVVGIDTSQWQHPYGAAIDWDAVRRGGASFAVIRASAGPGKVGSGNYTDPWFARDWAAAGAVGLYRGAYHFAEPSWPASNALTDARWFVAVTGPMSGEHDLPPVLDLEVTNGLDPASLAAWTATWLGEVARLTGRRPMIYTGYDFWRNAMGDTRRFSGYPLWFARWTDAATPTPMLDAWAAWTFWQWKVGTWPGIQGAVDLDRFAGSSTDLARYTGSTSGPPVAATNLDGRMEVFAASATGELRHTWQLQPNSAWSGWIPLDGARTLGDPTIVSNADGRLEAFGVAFDGTVIHEWQVRPNSAWSGWTGLAGGPSAAAEVAVVRNVDGRLELFALGADGSLRHQWQVAAGGAWSGWASLDGALTSAPSAIVDGTGRVVITARGAGGDLVHIRQGVPGGGWEAWGSLGGSIDGTPAVVTTGNGAVAVFAAADGAIATRTETSPGGSWTAWRQLDAGVAAGSRPSAARNPDGRLEVFVTTADGRLAHAWQTAVGATAPWSGWLDLGTGLSDDPTVDTNADGRLEVFATTRAGPVVHAWQLVAGGPWSPLVRL